MGRHIMATKLANAEHDSVLTDDPMTSDVDYLAMRSRHAIELSRLMGKQSIEALRFGLEWRKEHGPFVIIHVTDLGPSYWSIDAGWVGRGLATVFTLDERNSFDLPPHGKWVAA